MADNLPTPPNGDNVPVQPDPAAAPSAARVTLTVLTVTTRAAVAYAEVRCPMCDRLILEVPTPHRVLARPVTRGQYSGRGVVLSCGRCRTLIEVATVPPAA